MKSVFNRGRDNDPRDMRTRRPFNANGPEECTCNSLSAFAALFLWTRCGGSFGFQSTPLHHHASLSNPCMEPVLACF